MRFERHARTRFISSKSTLVNFQQGWKKKPQVAMKLPDFCLAPLESSLFSKLLYPPPNPSVGCWDPRTWSVYHSKRPTYACAKNLAILCLFYVVLTWAPLTTFQIALPTTALVIKSNSDRILAPKLLQFLDFRISVGSLLWIRNIEWIPWFWK